MTADPDLADLVGVDTIVVVVASGVILIWALALGDRKSVV